jgi:hypothetical protein
VQVGPSIWLGVAWLVDPVNYQQPNNAGLVQPFIDALKPLENATYKGVLEAIGVQGPNSSPTTSGITMPEPVRPQALRFPAINAAQIRTSKCTETCVLTALVSFAS